MKAKIAAVVGGLCCSATGIEIFGIRPLLGILLIIVGGLVILVAVGERRRREGEI